MRQGPKTSERPLILVVEDHKDARDLCAAFLRHEGFRVVTAKDGRQGRDQALQLRPDLIVMDLALPAIDGASVTRILRNHERTASIPVIAVTAYDPVSFGERAIAAGCERFHQKPLVLENLVKDIRQLISKTA